MRRADVADHDRPDAEARPDVEPEVQVGHLGDGREGGGHPCRALSPRAVG